MDKSTIQTLIDKVIGKKGLIRVPSWWMRKVLMQIADWVQEGDDANSEKIVQFKEETNEKIVQFKEETNGKIVQFKEETNGKISNLDNYVKAALLELKKSLHTQKCIIVKAGANAGYIMVDGVRLDIPKNTQKTVTYDGTFNFYENSNPNYLTFIGLIVTDTSSITDMSNLFRSCRSLTSLDLVGLDTSAVTNMSYMFYDCRQLSSLDLSSFNTSAVTDMSYMFRYCSRLTSLDLSSFDTSAVTNMTYMFQDCTRLDSLDLSSFNTSAVTDMSCMF